MSSLYRKREAEMAKKRKRPVFVTKTVAVKYRKNSELFERLKEYCDCTGKKMGYVMGEAIDRYLNIYDNYEVMMEEAAEGEKKSEASSD